MPRYLPNRPAHKQKTTIQTINLSRKRTTQTRNDCITALRCSDPRREQNQLKTTDSKSTGISTSSSPKPVSIDNTVLLAQRQTKASHIVMRITLFHAETHLSAGLTHAIITVCEFPPRLLWSNRVSFESRYGMCTWCPPPPPPAPTPPPPPAPALSDNAEMTFPRANSPLLILIPSRRRRPWVYSTREEFNIGRTFPPYRDKQEVKQEVNQESNKRTSRKQGVPLQRAANAADNDTLLHPPKNTTNNTTIHNLHTHPCTEGARPWRVLQLQNKGFIKNKNKCLVHLWG